MACTSLPVINNGYITASASGRAEYECLAGFQLTGNKVIECDATDGWPRAPSCEVIKQDVNFVDSSSNLLTFGPDWWFVFSAVILLIFLILCIVSVVLCCFCKKWKGATIYPIGGDVEERANEKRDNKSEQGTRNKQQEFRKVEKTSSKMARSGMTPVEKPERVPLSTSGVFVSDESRSIPVHEYQGQGQSGSPSRLGSESETPLTYIHLEDESQDGDLQNGPTASQKVLQRTNEKFLNGAKTVEIHDHHFHKQDGDTSPERYKKYPNYGEGQWQTSGNATSQDEYSSMPVQITESPYNRNIYRSKYHLEEMKNYRKKLEEAQDKQVWRPHFRPVKKY